MEFQSGGWGDSGAPVQYGEISMKSIVRTKLYSFGYNFIFSYILGTITSLNFLNKL